MGINYQGRKAGIADGQMLSNSIGPLDDDPSRRETRLPCKPKAELDDLGPTYTK